jgi:hypothetical protein
MIKRLSLLLPLDGTFSVGNQIFIGLAEVLVSKESVVGG